MPKRIKRGLGLLLLAIPFLMVNVALFQWAPMGTAAVVLHLLLALVFGLGLWFCLIAGLGMIIWSLLRD